MGVDLRTQYQPPPPPPVVLREPVEPVLPPPVLPQAPVAPFAPATPPVPLDPAYHPQFGSLPLPGGTPTVPLAETIAGQAPQATDLEMMELSAAVYDPSITQVGQWTRVQGDALPPGLTPAMFDTPDTGFKAGLFVNPQGDHVLAFAGSETDLQNQSARQDWIDDVVQGAGFTTGQYNQAAQLAQQVSGAYDGNVVMTGHSLGGGLASLAAAVTGAPAVTFNAAGVHDNTYRQFGIDPAATRASAADGQIRAYRIDGEFLTSVQEGVWGVSAAVPDAAGHPIVLRDPDPPTVEPSWNPLEFADSLENYVIDNLGTPFRLHTQDALLEAMREQHPWAP